MLCPRCIFCGYFALSNGPNWKVICILPIFVVNIWVLDLPNWWYIGFTPYFLVLHIEEKSSCFVLNVFWGYFALINGPNCEVICIIPIFGVIFSENLGIWPPGVTIYRFTPYYFPIIFQEMSPCFVLDVFCVHFSLWHVQIERLLA